MQLAMSVGFERCRLLSIRVGMELMGNPFIRRTAFQRSPEGIGALREDTKFFQEEILDSLIILLVKDFCFLYEMKFSREGWCLNLLRAPFLRRMALEHSLFHQGTGRCLVWV